MAEEVTTKKVKPYPFAAGFDRDGIKFVGRVLKLVMHGLMVDVGEKVLKVGDVYEVQFEFPVIKDLVVASVKVIKTYDKYQLASEQKAIRLAEFHFVKLSLINKENIKKFLKAIRQIGDDLV